MRRWFLSYTSQDFPLTQALKAALKRKDPDADIFLAPESMRAGGFWKEQLAKEIEEFTAFILLVGEKGLGDWQVMEYYEALDRRAREPNYPIILILSAKRPAPGLPFARQLHWVTAEDPASEGTVGKLLDAASGPAHRPKELWRFTRPYRGLEAMTEANSDYFFGRDGKTVEVINALASAPGKLPILLGNSGVGKSSLAQAGVLASLLRQGWSDRTKDAPPWPEVFHDSRRWCFLTLRPGTQPLQSLVALFLDTWQYVAASSERVKEEKGWIELLRDGKAGLSELLNATERRYKELAQTARSAFFLYIDQGEELYVRADQTERQRFSEILAHGLRDRRLRALMSMRSDFLGELQGDELLFDAHRQINVPPLREPDLRDVVTRPAELLSAHFETDGVAPTIARRTAEESTKDAGALPLLSYLLDDMWTHMVDQGDGILRLPEQAFELGGVLVRRANAFVSAHPNSEDKLRRIFTLKLATVREDGEPTRRRAWRSEFSDEEWRLVSELADHPNRLLATATPDADATPLGPETAKPESNGAPASRETYAEVAHEAIFRRWERLRDWIAAEREFLAWRNGQEAARRAWQATPDASKDDALLMGLGLAQAQSWLVKRQEDLPRTDREFIERSLKREAEERHQRERMRRRGKVLIATVAALIIVACSGLYAWLQRNAAERNYSIVVDMTATQLKLIENQLGVGISETVAKEILASVQKTIARLPQDTEARIKLLLVFSGVQTADVSQALSFARQAEALALLLVAGNPGNNERLLDLADAFDRVGDLLRAQGDLVQASQKYRNELALLLRLASSSAGADLKPRFRGLREKIGDVLRMQGDLVQALTYYQSALSDLAPGDRRDLALSHDKVAQVLWLQGNRVASLAELNAALTIWEGLASEQPGNIYWQVMRVVERSKIASATAAGQDAQAALLPDFILPASRERRLGQQDIAGLGREQLRLARNEIFARHGRYFKEPVLGGYFSQFLWYRPYTWLTLTDLTADETANVDFLSSAE